MAPLARRRLAAALALAVVAAASPNVAGAIAILGSERSLFVEATALAADDFDARFDEASAPPGGAPFAAGTATFAAVAPVAGEASAALTASLGALALAAAGRADAVGVATADVFNRGTFAGESFFDVVFAPGGARGFLLEVALASSAVPTGDGFASVELVAIGAGGAETLLFQREVANGASLVENVTGALDPAATYRLTAFALGVALVDDLAPAARAGGSFDLAFVPVFVAAPAPSAASLLALAPVAALLARLARRRPASYAGGRP